jgi:hypothetical protein
MVGNPTPNGASGRTPLSSRRHEQRAMIAMTLSTDRIS